jgi:hypothetical protein
LSCHQCCTSEPLRDIIDMSGIVITPIACGHAAADVMFPEQLAVVGGPILTALVRVDNQLFRFYPAVAQSPVEGCHHQGGCTDPSKPLS